MTVELTNEELELIVRALGEHAIRRSANGLSTDQADALVQKLGDYPGSGSTGGQPPSPQTRS